MPSVSSPSPSCQTTSELPDFRTSGPGQRRSTSGPRQSAFTLIELLVVIGVIVTLMGLLIPAVTIAKSKAKKTQTVNFLAQIQAACSSFKNENGYYPQADMTATGWATNANHLLTALRTVNREDFRGELKDSYGSVVHYRPAKFYPFTTGLTAGLINSDDPPGADSFQLWSLGPNKRDDVSLATDPKDLGDDLVTWKK